MNTRTAPVDLAQFEGHDHNWPLSERHVLLAECKRQREELERAEANRQHWAREHEKHAMLWTAERDRQREQITALMEALTAVVDVVGDYATQPAHVPFNAATWQRMQKAMDAAIALLQPQARAALKVKP